LLGDAGLGWGAAMVGGDLVGEVWGIVVDRAEQGRAPGMLPGQSQEVQARDLGRDAAVTTRPCSTAAGIWIQV